MHINQGSLQVLHIINVVCADPDCNVSRPFSFRSLPSKLEPDPETDPDILSQRFIREHSKDTGHVAFVTQSTITSTVKYTVRD